VFHQSDEALEMVRGVVRPRRGFGVILDAEHGMVSQAESFERLIVQIDVRDFGLRSAERFGIDREPVIMRRDLDFVW